MKNILWERRNKTDHKVRRVTMMIIITMSGNKVVELIRVENNE